MSGLLLLAQQIPTEIEKWTVTLLLATGGSFCLKKWMDEIEGRRVDVQLLVNKMEADRVEYIRKLETLNKELFVALERNSDTQVALKKELSDQTGWYKAVTRNIVSERLNLHKTSLTAPE